MTNQTPAQEEGWWSALLDVQIVVNTGGLPPYDVERVADRIVGDIVYPGRILDMGCGIGRLTNHIATTLDRSTVYGFDISAPFVHSAASTAPGNVHYWHSDGRTIPDGLPGKFDLIYSVTMFQHIPHDAKWGYILQAADRLYQGGTLIFTVAVGDEPPSFLNHQLTRSELEQFADAMTDIFSAVSIDGPDENNWTWMEAHA